MASSRDSARQCGRMRTALSSMVATWNMGAPVCPSGAAAAERDQFTAQRVWLAPDVLYPWSPVNGVNACVQESAS